MYGLLRPATQYLDDDERKTYAQMYCGQCVALHDHFGCISRILTSHDAAFFGLLIAAQRNETSSVSKRRCAIYFKKMDVCASEDIVAHISAALAVYSGAIKLVDKQQDGNSLFLTMLENLFSTKAKKASSILTSYGIPGSLSSETLYSQHVVEQRKTNKITDYVRPSEVFLSDMLRSTAIVAKKPENCNVLARLGTCLGRIIYLVDSCVDLLDDLKKQEFNALLAVYADDDAKKLHPDTGDQVTDLIMQSLIEIRDLLPQLKLVRHKEIVVNILTAGLPFMIQQQLSRSMRRLKKSRPKLLQYAPHAALTAALCIFQTQSAYARNALSNSNDNVCGFACSNLQKDPSCALQSFDFMCNPCFYAWASSKEIQNQPCDAYCCSMPCAITCQAPKVFALFYALMNLNEIKDKYTSWSEKSKETRKKQVQEFKHQSGLIREKRNTDFLEKTTKDLMGYKKSILTNLAMVEGKTLYDDSAWDMFFSKKLQRLTPDKQSVLFSSSPEIGDGIKELTREAQDLDKKILNLLESLGKIRQEIVSARQSLESGDTHSDNQLKLYEELFSPVEIKSLIIDQRFDDFYVLDAKIHDELSRLGQ